MLDASSIIQFKDRNNAGKLVYPKVQFQSTFDSSNYNLDTYITEYNVNAHDGSANIQNNFMSDKTYTLEEAIARLPEQYKRTGIKLTFKSVDSSVDTYVYDGSTFVNANCPFVSGEGVGSAILRNNSGTALGQYATGEGYQTKAQGAFSHSEGAQSLAQGIASHAEGKGTRTNNIGEHAEGTFNKSNTGTRHSVGIGTTDDDRKNAFEIMQNGDTYLYGVGGYDGTNATASSSRTLQQVLSNVGCLTEITWSVLKSLRDSSGLTPGMQYRITDYNTTTVQSNTQAAGHQFDIIVVADDNHTLNENARAVRHEGDTYFRNSTLEAWELKYDIDNDTSKYEWADSGSTGRGVIYYMKDEWNNECPYDFKNIQFDITDNAYSACYTFGLSDATANGSKNVYNNVIKEWRSGIRERLKLNNIIFQIAAAVTSCHSNKFGINCHDNIFGDDCYNNIFGAGCYNNKFDRTCYNNIFGTDCFSNYFAGTTQGCHDNQFGNDCHDNMLSELCREITFGNGCSNNIFGEDCSRIRFGNECSYIKTGTVNRLKSFYSNIIVEDGNRHIYLNCTGTLSDIRYYQNVKIALGVNNTYTWKAIDDSNVNQNFETIYRPSNSLIISV